MKRIFLLAIGILLTISIPFALCSGQTKRIETSRLPSTIERLSPSIVVVSTAVDGDRRIFGTGFAVASGGYFVTCYHLITGTDLRIGTVQHGSYKSLKAELVGMDSINDLALLKTSANFKPLLMNLDPRKPGESVSTTGFAFGPAIDGSFVHTTMSGIISCIRSGSNKARGQQPQLDASTQNTNLASPTAKLYDRLQLDMIVEGGSSGGPVYLTGSGLVIGIISSSLEPRDRDGPAVRVGFAVSAQAIQNLLKLSLPPVPQSGLKSHKKRSTDQGHTKTR